MNHEPFAINHLKIVFFGSFQTYSVRVLEKLTEHYHVTAVITTPPKPAGRHMLIASTHVAKCAKKNTLPLFELDDLTMIPGISRPDYLVVAGYGKLIPKIWLDFPKIMPINLHPSLLPNYRGAFPAEWAILRGEKETGVSLVQMTEEFDKGPLLAKQSLTITQSDTRETLYEKLYALGASLLVKTLPQIALGEIKLHPQPKGTFVYARKITRDDGFIPWDLLQQAVLGSDVSLEKRPKLFSLVIGHWSLVIERALRALSSWPGVWTILPNGNRLKLLTITPTVLVQLEGKNPVTFSQFISAYPQLMNEVTK